MIIQLSIDLEISDNISDVRKEVEVITNSISEKYHIHGYDITAMWKNESNYMRNVQE